MSAISFTIDVHAIRDAIQDEAGSYVKHIWDERKRACIEAAGEVLDENGYLPEGTIWVASGDECWFYVEKDGKDLTGHFYEHEIYGPNFFVKKLGEWRSPKGKKKFPTGRYYTSPKLGVRHWISGLIDEDSGKEGPLYAEFISRCEEILRR